MMQLFFRILLILALAALPANAQLLPLLGVAAGGQGASSGLTIAYQSNGVIAGNQPSYTFSSQPIGSPSASALVVVLVAYERNTTFPTSTSLTINGTSANEAPGAFVTEATNNEFNDIFYLSGITGSTATIVATTPDNAIRCFIFVYTVTGSGVAFSSATATAATTNVSSVSTSLTVPTSGGMIGLINAHTASETYTGINLSLDGSPLVNGANTGQTGNNTSLYGSNTFGFNIGTASTAAVSLISFSP
jgi:hypothetical protein